EVRRIFARLRGRGASALVAGVPLARGVAVAGEGQRFRSKRDHGAWRQGGSRSGYLVAGAVEGAAAASSGGGAGAACTGCGGWGGMGRVAGGRGSEVSASWTRLG